VIKFRISIIGSYPRSPSLGKVFSRFRAGKVSKDILEKEVMRRESTFLSLVKDIGAHYSTDGLLRWDDLLDVTFSYLSGQEKGELMRFFDNNFYYRKPVIKDRLRARLEEYLSYLQGDIELAKQVGYTGTLKAVIVGPLTYSLLSDNQYYETVEELIMSYSAEVNSVLKNLPRGINAVEIHEPSIFAKGVKTSLLDRLKDAYQTLLSGVQVEKHLITYFYINSSRIDLLLSLPVDVYGFDIIENMNILGVLYRKVKERRVFLGVLDTRNTKIERVSTIRRVVEKAREKGASEVLIGNAAPMDFIPEAVVIKKLKLLKKIGGA
jgi:5-methyltetrahydropteroyltriglutamate--homocysteine methyltransferase